ncbi:MAG TPA: hypothetical protein PKI14_07940 [Fervidobacterium sp.]|nr:hypothetical protein [Fervidobacterium sp.]
MKKDRYLWQCNRYHLDFGLCSFRNGFAQVAGKDVWVNPFNLKIVSLNDGSIEVITADNEEEFREAIKDYQVICGCNGDLEEKLMSLGIPILEEVKVC